MAETTVSNDFHPIPQTPLSDKKIQLTYDPTNGDVILYTTVAVNGTQTAKTEIYKNGIWDALSGIPDLNERIKIHDKVKNKIKDVRKISGTGVLPGFVVNDSPSQDQSAGGGVPTGTPQNPILGLLDAFKVLDPIGALTPFDVSGDAFKSENEEKLFKNSKLLIYPIDMITSKQDRLEITQYRYKPTGADALFKNPTEVIQKGIQRRSPLSIPIGTTILPIPNGIADGNNVSWGDDQMNNLTAGATGKVMNSMPAVLGAATAGGLLGGGGGLLGALAQYKMKMDPTLSPAAGAGTGAKAAIQTAVTFPAMLDALQGKESRGSLSAGLASQILGIAGFEVSPESILARGFGIVPNSNLELLFNAPTLRQFSFAYRMSPRSEVEARNVKRIIRFFKQGMAPRKQTGQAGQSSYFLGTPNVFKLKYKTGKGSAISGLNRFKICALTSFSVNYAPEGNWAAYDAGQPVTLTMAMQFSELEPIFNTDYQTSIFQYRNDDLDPVQDDDVGY